MTVVHTRTLAERQEAYRCLAILFCSPDIPSLREHDVGQRLRKAVEAFAPVAVSAARDVASALEREPDLEVQKTHARLFVGPGRLAAPPYGSVYLDDERRLMGPSTDRVLAAYSEAGLDLDRGAHEAPDHIAVELEFLQFLDWQAAAAGSEAVSQRWTALRRRFLRELVAPWVPALSRAIHAAQPGPLYGALATCLEAVVSFDCEQRA